MMDNIWFTSFKTNPSNPYRLFCFHFAGGSASAYRSWSKDIASNIDLIAIQLPGRENRFGEPLIDKIEVIVENLYDHFLDFHDKPYIFFGHSLGALIAFEFANKLQERGHLGLKHLIVSGSRAPHVPLDRRPIYNLPDVELFAEIQKYNGIPQELRNEKELLMEIMLPIIRADFTISDLYQCNPTLKLLVPITAFGGNEDYTFAFASLLKWSVHTDIFRHIHFSGDHFFINSSYQEVITQINKIINQ